MVLKRILLILALAFAARQTEIQKIYIGDARCTNVSTKYIYPNVSCFAKSFNRSFSTANAYIHAKKPLVDLFATFEILYRYGLVYRQVLRTNLINVCRLTSNKGDVLIEQILNIFNDSAPSLIHPCPYVITELKNVYIKSRTLQSIFPSGEYKVFASVYESNELIYVARVWGKINSPNKDTFG